MLQRFDLVYKLFNKINKPLMRIIRKGCKSN